MSRTSPRPSPSHPLAGRRRRGFTLVEVMIGATIAAFILLAVLSSFLMIGRNGYNMANYSIMEAEARRALETFSAEARMANNIVWNSERSITLTIPLSSGSYRVSYIYDNSAENESNPAATGKTFYREQITSPVGSGQPAVGTKRILCRKVTEFSFGRYKVINGVDYTANNDLETKQIQISLRAVRTGYTTVATTNAVLSARVVLRNKAVTT